MKNVCDGRASGWDPSSVLYVRLFDSRNSHCCYCCCSRRILLLINVVLNFTIFHFTFLFDLILFGFISFCRFTQYYIFLSVAVEAFCVCVCVELNLGTELQTYNRIFSTILISSLFFIHADRSFFRCHLPFHF